MRVKLNLIDTMENTRRALRRDKALMQAILEALRVADRAGNSECRVLLARALSQA